MWPQEQDAPFVSSPDRLWRALPENFKNQYDTTKVSGVFLKRLVSFFHRIHEIREGHMAKTTMTAKLDKVLPKHAVFAKLNILHFLFVQAKDEIALLKGRVKQLDELRVELANTAFELDRQKLTHRTFGLLSPPSPCLMRSFNWLGWLVGWFAEKDLSAQRKEYELRVEKMMAENALKIQVTLFLFLLFAVCCFEVWSGSLVRFPGPG